MKYDMDKNNHQYWLNKGHWYNTSICLKLHGKRFEDFITQAITDRYNLMCSLVYHGKLQPDYKDDESSIGCPKLKCINCKRETGLYSKTSFS